MDAIVVDIDDTLVDTERRRHSAWCRVLGREIPMEVTESSGSREILRRYAFSNEDVWEKFWMLLLCVEEDGVNLIEFDKPLPYASEVLRAWKENYKVVYLTGRTENMRQLTLNQLKKFEFPTRGADLEMFTLKTWTQFLSSTASVIQTRERIFSSILERYNVIRVVDDYPDFFAAYRGHPVPDRIGLLRKKRFSRQDYLANGATRIVESWEQLTKE